MRWLLRVAAETAALLGIAAGTAVLTMGTLLFAQRLVTVIVY